MDLYGRWTAFPFLLTQCVEIGINVKLAAACPCPKKPGHKERRYYGVPLSNNETDLLTVNALHQQVCNRFLSGWEMNPFSVAKERENNFCSHRPFMPLDSFGADRWLYGRSAFTVFWKGSFGESAHFAMACAALSRASTSINNPTLSVHNAQYLLKHPGVTPGIVFLCQPNENQR